MHGSSPCMTTRGRLIPMSRRRRVLVSVRAPTCVFPKCAAVLRDEQFCTIHRFTSPNDGARLEKASPAAPRVSRRYGYDRKREELSSTVEENEERGRVAGGRQYPAITKLSRRARTHVRAIACPRQARDDSASTHSVSGLDRATIGHRRLNSRSTRLGQMSLALSPPVTSYSAPVTMLAASEARNTAAGEISSGCNQPTFIGTVAARMSQASCGDGWDGSGRPVSAIVSPRRFSHLVSAASMRPGMRASATNVGSQLSTMSG